MTPVATATPQTSQLGWFSRAEAWLDSKGKGAWIAAMVLGFIFVWPVGLALLFYMIWSKRMFSKSRSVSCGHRRMYTMASTGNTAFDSYRDEMIRRLEDEQSAFEGFLDRLRQAKDRAEFDQFRAEHRAGPATDAQPAG